MAKPKEFSFVDEAAFTAAFLVPLFKRMGFNVFHYHGTAEFGKDLLLSEIDAFGYFRYHGVQAKYVDSVSQSDSHGLIEDCREAFSNEFLHPHTGTRERISTFLAVNAGSIADNARANFFNTLRHVYGANVFMLDGKELLKCDATAALESGRSIMDTLNGILAELRLNGRKRPLIEKMLIDYKSDTKNPLPIDHLRDTATASYLVRPILPDELTLDKVLTYSELVRCCGQLTDHCITSLGPPEVKLKMVSTTLEQLAMIGDLEQEIERNILGIIQRIGPVSSAAYLLPPPPAVSVNVGETFSKRLFGCGQLFA